VFNSAKDFLKYLQIVFKDADIEKVINKQKAKEWGKLFKQREKLMTEPLDSYKIDPRVFDYYNNNYNRDGEDLSEIDIMSCKPILDILLKETEKYLPSFIAAEKQKIAYGTLFNFFIDAQTIKSQEGFLAVLISGTLLRLLYTNICYLEAIPFPQNVEYYSGNPYFEKYNTEDYLIIYSEFLLYFREVNTLPIASFAFKAHSRESVYQHFEFIVVFILFHEYGHIINRDLDKQENYSKDNILNKNKDMELKADIRALELMIEHCDNKFPYEIKPYEIVLTLEHYFFRLLYAININIKGFPTSKERVINLLDECKKRYNMPHKEYRENIELFDKIYK